MVFRLGAPRRSEVEIICDILEICLEGATKTSIVYRANLNFSRLDRYLSMLIGIGYLSLGIVSGENNKNETKIVYVTTEQGKHFLANFANMQRCLESLSNSRSKMPAKPLI
jgi:predicted transcriptional regulator